MKVAELLSEGFMDFTVSGSDTAADAAYAVEEALKKAEKKIRQNKMLPDAAVNLMLCKEAIKQLQVALKEKGNAYNTHGTLNVAMILKEQFKEFRKFKEWQEFALDVATRLRSETSTGTFSGDGEYQNEMRNLIPQLEKLGK